MGAAWEWFIQHSFDVLSAIGIIGGLVFSAFSYRSEAKTRRVANLIAITANHREIWREFMNNPALARVLDASAHTNNITDAEEMFVSMIISHINSIYYATKDELIVKLDGLRRDIAGFLSLPIPLAVWNKNKAAQNDDFAAFVEACRNWK